MVVVVVRTGGMAGVGYMGARRVEEMCLDIG